MKELKIEKNKSITYFLPLFARVVPIRYFNLLENTYLWYDDYKNDVFCLLYRFSGKVTGSQSTRDGFTVYEERELTKHKLFRGYQDYGEYTIYQFEVPDELINARHTILQGKYSRLDENDRQAIINFTMQYYGPNEMHHIKQILERNQELRLKLADSLGYDDLPESFELSSPIDLDRELFANCVIN